MAVDKGYQYEILIRKIRNNGSAPWVRSSKSNVSIGTNILGILNRYGKKGWDVAGVGNLGGSPHAEIILKRPIA